MEIRKKKLKRKHEEQGSVLIVGVTTMTLLLFFALPFLFQISTDNKVTDNKVIDNKVTYKIANYSSALSLAEAGVEMALWEMNYGDISNWEGNSKFKTMAISSYKAPEGNVTGDIEIRIEEPGGENPVVKSTGRVAYISSLGGGKTARVVLERTARVELKRDGYSWVCSFPKRQIRAVRAERSIIY